jgi:hypothetical protein
MREVVLIEHKGSVVFTPPCDLDTVRFNARLEVDTIEGLPYLNATLAVACCGLLQNGYARVYGRQRQLRAGNRCGCGCLRYLVR